MENQVILALKNNKLLKNILFDDLNLENIKGQLLTKSEGEIIFREADAAESLYLVVSGEINLLKKRDSQKTESFVFGENDFFGSDEFLQQEKRRSTAVALRDSYIIALSKPEVDNLIEQSDEIIANIYESVDTADAGGGGVIDVPEAVAEQPGLETADDLSLEGFDDINIIEDPGSDTVNDPVIEQPVRPIPETPQVNETTITEKPSAPIVTDNSSPADDSLNISLDDIPSTDAPAVKNEILNLDDNLDSSSDLLNDEISFNEDELDAGLAESTPELDPVSESSPDTLPADKAAPVEEKAPEEPEPVIRKTTFSGTNSFELLEKINDAAQLVNSNIKIEKVLQNIVKVATDLTSADRGTLYLVEKDKNELWSMIAMGNDFKEIKLKIGEGIAGWVAQKGDTINLENAQEDSRFNVSFDKTSGYTTKSMICFPIKDRNNEICGVLQLLNSSNGKFSKVDEELLEALSYHAAMALQNAELVEQLLKGERISSLGKMANFLIQDIKKPIMVSKRYTEHLKSKELPEDLSKVVDMVLEQLDHIAELVNSTSNYSEGQIVSRSHLRSINEVLEEFVTRIESFVVSRNCNIVHDLEKDVNVQVSEKQLYQAFQHLIKNACDAMPDGGEITLFTENVDNGVAITVKDSGLGIPETLHEKIFEPFMSHGKKEGTGLGLSITKKIVEEHSGSISVASEIGEGAKFTITLPIASA